MPVQHTPVERPARHSGGRKLAWPNRHRRKPLTPLSFSRARATTGRRTASGMLPFTSCRRQCGVGPGLGGTRGFGGRRAGLGDVPMVTVDIQALADAVDAITGVNRTPSSSNQTPDCRWLDPCPSSLADYLNQTADVVTIKPIGVGSVIPSA